MEKREPSLPFNQKMYYGLGTLPSSFYSSFYGQLQAFFYAWMGLSVGYIFLAQVIYAIWNVINDPIFGILEDRTRTKRGRYIPWIKWFSPVFTIAFISIFFVPSEWRYAYGGENTQLLVFLWYLITLCFYDLAYTIVGLAHAALLPQIAHNFKDRTDMSVMVMIFSGIGTVVSMAFPLLFLTNPTAEKIFWLKVAVFIFGAASMIPWVLIWRNLKERMELIPEEKESFWTNVKHVFKNPACRVYVIYDGITVGINETFIASVTFMIAWIMGFENPYAHQSIEIINLLPYAICPLVGAIFGVWFQLNYPKKKDLKTTILWDYVFMAVGFLLAYIGALPSPVQPDNFFEQPPNLWLVSIGFGILLMGFLGSMIYLNPLNADVVDYDEILTGARREGVYSGLNCIFSKPMYSVVITIFPAILAAYGLIPARPGDPTSEALVVISGFHNAITGVATASFLFPAILATIGFFAFLSYPLNGKKVAEMRKILDEKHARQRLALQRKLNESSPPI